MPPTGTDDEIKRLITSVKRQDGWTSLWRVAKDFGSAPPSTVLTILEEAVSLGLIRVAFRPTLRGRYRLEPYFRLPEVDEGIKNAVA